MPCDIGTRNEGSLHAQLKKLYAGPGSRTEVPVGRYVADLLRPDGEIIEIQTRGLVKLRSKLTSFLETHRVRLVHPLPVEKVLVFRDPVTDAIAGRRSSPKRSQLLDVVDELSGLAAHLPHPRLTVEILLTREEEIRCRDGQGSRSRGGTSVLDRSLVHVIETVTLRTPSDYREALLPEDLPRRFTNGELARRLGVSRPQAAQLTYCLRAAGVLFLDGKQGREHVHGVRDEAAGAGGPSSRTPG